MSTSQFTYYLLLQCIAVTCCLASSVLADNAKPVKSLLELRHDHVVVQQWDLSCGAAALATLLNYQHSDSVSEREVAQTLIQRKEYIDNPSLVRKREGFSLLDLKRYVDERGYQGIGLGKLEMDDLIEQAPIMVAVNLNGYNHFVIFRGLLKNRVLIADPAWGNRTLLKDKFLDAWIQYPEFGRVGFVVQPTGDSAPLNSLEAGPQDFVFLR